MANEQERKKLARLIDRLPENVRGYGPATQEARLQSLEIADRILAAGYHTGPRLPDPDSPEEAEAVERMAKMYWFEVYGKHRTNNRWPEDVLGGSQDLFRGGCLAALRVLRGQTDGK